jgi:hypothetical protein
MLMLTGIRLRRCSRQGSRGSSLVLVWQPKRSFSGQRATKERTGQSHQLAHRLTSTVPRLEGPERVLSPEAPWVGSERGFLRVPWRAFSKNDKSGGNATGASSRYA